MTKTYDLSVSDVVAISGLSHDMVRHYARHGRLPARKNASGRWMFSRDDELQLRNPQAVIDQ